MTDDELIEKMRERIAATWGDGRVTRQTYATAGPVEQKRFDACARAALAIARPIIEREALEKAAAWHDARRRLTPDAFEMEFHRVSAAAIRELGDDNEQDS